MAPALRWLLKEVATGAALGFLESTRVGCRVPAEAARLSVDEGRGGEGGPGVLGGRRVGRARLRLYFLSHVFPSQAV